MQWSKCVNDQIPCIYCGHPWEAVDHIQPRSHGGTDTKSNLAPACKSCNSAKGDRPVSYFLREHPNILARVHAHQSGEDVLSRLTPDQKPQAKDTRKGQTLRLSAAAWRQLKVLAMDEGATVHQ